MKYGELIIGLTGGIGSGKSAAATAFAKLGITIIDADIAARRVVEPGQPALNEIIQHFGIDVLLEDKTLDRQKLRTLVFSNNENRLWLNKLLHPLIRLWMEEQVSVAKSSYVIQVIPLLFESKLESQVDRVLVIDVPIETQVNRVIKRDNSNQNEIEKIIQQQTSRQHRLDKTDDIILNDSTLAELEQDVLKMHNKYLKLVDSAYKKNSLKNNNNE